MQTKSIIFLYQLIGGIHNGLASPTLTLHFPNYTPLIDTQAYHNKRISSRCPSVLRVQAMGVMHFRRSPAIGQWRLFLFKLLQEKGLHAQAREVPPSSQPYQFCGECTRQLTKLAPAFANFLWPSVKFRLISASGLDIIIYQWKHHVLPQ